MRGKRIAQGEGCARDRVHQTEPAERGQDRPDRLQRVLRQGPRHGGLSRGHLLPAGETRGCSSSRGGALYQGPPGPEVPVHAADGKEDHPGDERDPVLQAPGAARAPEPEPHRRREDRGIHRPGRVHGSGQGAHGDDARADRDRDEEIGPARPRRRRVPDRTQMGALRARSG